MFFSLFQSGVCTVFNKLHTLTGSRYSMTPPPPHPQSPMWGVNVPANNVQKYVLEVLQCYGKKPPKPVLFISCQSQLEKERTSLSKQQKQNNRMSQLESQRASQRLRVNTHTQTHIGLDLTTCHRTLLLIFVYDMILNYSLESASPVPPECNCKNVKIQLKPFSLTHGENLMFQIHSNSGIIISGYTVVTESI